MVDMLTIKGTYTKVVFNKKDDQDDIELSIETSDKTYTHYLTQEDIKTLIAHLQKQIV